MVYVLVGVILIGVFLFVFMKGGTSLEREIGRKMKEAVELQRNGKLREYGELMREVEEMEEKLLACKLD